MHPLLVRFIRWTGLSFTRCPICAALTDRESGPLCIDCAEAMFPRMGGFCPQCGEMYGVETNPPTICGTCRHEPQPWHRIYFHNRYEGRLRDVILKYKFHGGIGQTSLLSGLALDTFYREAERVPDVIIPVPLHNRRLLWRGFNQSREMARALGRAIERPVLRNGLTRIRHTVPQTRLGLKARQTNIKDAFAADQKQIDGKLVLLVDDVYTTGATLRECTKTLLKAGAAGVDVLVLARTAN